MTLSQLQHTIAHYRAQLAAREQAALQTLARAHAQTVQIIDARMQVLWKAIESAGEAGQALSVNKVLEYERLYSIQQFIGGHIDSYGAYARHVTLLLQQQGVSLGSAAAQALLQATVPRGVAFAFGMPSQDALQSLIGATQAGSPLADLFAGFGAEAAQAVKQTLLTGLTLGQNPRDVAESVAQDLNVSQWRAQTIARTSMLQAYRDSSTANYQANADVLEGWRWSCALSSRTCAACLAMNGEVFSVDEDMESHPNCRCVPVPITKSWSDILDGTGIDTSELDDSSITDDMPTGADWLASQSADVQQKVLGKSGYALYSTGTPLKDFVTVTHDKTWGKSIRQTSVKEIVKR